MKKHLLTFSLFCFVLNLQAQKKEFKCQEIYTAVKLMDAGQYDESIAMLKECEKVDPTDHAYPYEIALAYTYKKEYQNAVNQLEKIKNYNGLQADYYQLLGNAYDYVGQPEKAIRVYDEGLKKFPNAGRLYLEKGVVMEGQEKYGNAISYFEKGIEVDPMYPSNYYRAALLYLNSNDKLTGLLYGEIFMNLERTTKRTQNMSKKLYETYKNSITFNGNNTKIDLCNIVIDANTINDKGTKLPFCSYFGSNFILATVGQNEINLNSLARIRTEFIKLYFKKDFKKYPNVLLEYQKKLLDLDFLDIYSRYLFQLGAETEFNDWKSENEDAYNTFAEWYKKPENKIKINQDNVYIAN
ncbi:tetratricopeptide repeat protein [Flavobacterium mesophilum]|uniref:tetratricopeptide repeat protein n=1 Tax=Flavobacterium mesophilum TaxID=3143495 RepID=UPI0031DC9BC8